MGTKQSKVNANKNTKVNGGPNRYIPFQGIRNFRDLGGYRTKAGHHIKWGKLFRSGQLSDLTPKDQGDFKALGIKLICDFRYESEQHRAPTKIEDSEGVYILNLPIKTGSFRSFFESIGVSEPGYEDMLEGMKEIYRNFVNEQTDHYANMFHHILETGNSTLIHCSAGKDRTGFGAAMILAALGVDKDIIMADYLLSAQYFSANEALAILEKNGSNSGGPKYDLDVFRPVYEVYPEYLLTAFEEIEQKFNSIDQYITDALGITPEIRQALKDKYLEKT